MDKFLSLKSREDQKKGPNIIQRSDADLSQIIRGDADEGHSQIIGEMQSNYWGNISPHPSKFRHPYLPQTVEISHSSISLQNVKQESRELCIQIKNNVYKQIIYKEALFVRFCHINSIMESCFT